MKSNQWIGSSRRKKSESVLVHAKKYMFENLVGTIAASGSFFGGLMLLIYLLDEKFFPANIDVSSIGLLLAAAALVGITLMVALSYYLVMPGYVYRNILSRELGNSPIGFLEKKTIFLLLDIPFITINLLFPIYLMTGTYQGCSKIAINFPIIVFAVGLIALISTVHIASKGESNLTAKKDAFIAVIISTVLTLFPLLMIWLIVGKYSQSGAPDIVVWLVIISMVGLVAFSNHLIAAAKNFWLLAIIPIGMFFLLLWISQQASLIPRMVVKALNIGDIQHVTLILDEQGCKASKQYIYQIDAENFEARNSSICTLSSVRIIWRIGNEYWVEVPVNRKIEKGEEGASTNKVIKFSLPASHVLSWSIQEDGEK